MPVLKDFRIKNGLVVGSDDAGTITAGIGNYSTSLSGTSLSSISASFTGTGGVKVPVGTTAQRPPAADGFIRLNNTLSQFEGYANSTWTGLGGVVDVDQDTKILPELTPGGDQDSLFFYTGGTERARITSAGLLSAASDVTVAGDLTVVGNSINSGNLTITGDLTVNGTNTTLNTSVTSTTTAVENNFVITSTDTGGTTAPDFKLWRDSASPADNDLIGTVIFTGNDSGGTATDYGQIYTTITDVTNATEDSRMSFKTVVSGTLADRLALTETGTLSASGQIIGNVTGDLTGNADTATALETARTIGGVSFDGTAAIVPTTIVVADTTSTNAYVGLFESATGNLLPKTDANIFYNASGSGKLTVTGTISAGGTIYADAFNSVTGGSTIDFNDPVDVAGTLTLDGDIVHSGDTDTKLSFTTDTITLYGANSNLLRIDGAGNVVGIGTVSTASPSIPTVIEFNNDTTAYKSASATITTGASAALLSIPTASYRSGKIVLQSVAASGGHMDITELLYIHNGTTVYTTEYATIRVGSAIGTYTGEIVGSNVEIRAVNGVGVTAEFVGSITMLSV